MLNYRRYALGSAVVLPISALCLLGALHVLEPSVSPLTSFLSEYALGRWGWLMSVAFILAASGATCLSALFFVEVGRSIPRDTLCVLLLAVGVSNALMAYLPKDRSDAGGSGHVSTAIGGYHNTLALVHGLLWLAVVVTTPAAIWLDPRTRRLLRFSLWALSPVALAMIARVAAPPDWVGLGQRVWVLAVVTWSVAHAWVVASGRQETMRKPVEPTKRVPQT